MRELFHQCLDEDDDLFGMGERVNLQPEPFIFEEMDQVHTMVAKNEHDTTHDQYIKNAVTYEDKIDAFDIPEELSLSVRKVSMQSDDADDVRTYTPRITPQRLGTDCLNLQGLNPVHYVEDAGTEASIDDTKFFMSSISTPKGDKANWLGTDSKRKVALKDGILKRSKAIDKKHDKKALAKQRLNLKKGKKEKVQTMRD